MQMSCCELRIKGRRESLKALKVLPRHAVQHKATHMTIICSKCKNTKVLTCKPGLGGAQFPRYCDAGAEAELGAENCGQDPYVVLPHKSRFSDLQTLKLQVGPPCFSLPCNKLAVLSCLLQPWQHVVILVNFLAQVTCRCTEMAGTLT